MYHSLFREIKESNLEDMLEGEASLLHVEEDGLLTKIDESPMDHVDGRYTINNI